ncbi:hypothetical protein K7432_013264 [Basidiobolus ranarum]|uniref:SCP domain-containing protein n=1 Tax=Basidiobolus ranarum TaxID=34480 RepID=A0ABR2WJJ4_9FUNG
MLLKSLCTISFTALALAASIQAFSPEKLICLVNRERVKQRLRPLVLSSELSEVCQRHSLMQAQYNKMTHDRYDHSPMDKAINEQGLNWSQYGENVARGQQNEQVVMNVWMHSPPHRRNILNPSFTHMGAALAQPGNYWTQGFATLPGTWSAPISTYNSTTLTLKQPHSMHKKEAVIWFLLTIASDIYDRNELVLT